MSSGAAVCLDALHLCNISVLTPSQRGHGPFPPQIQSLGNPPTPIPDVPVSAVFLALFIIAGGMHFKLFLGNKKNNHKFVFSGAMFGASPLPCSIPPLRHANLAPGFCKIRIVATVLRIVWSYYPHNVNLAIAANVFVQAGIIILFIVNLFFTQRLMRARHPHIGWSKPFKILIPPVTVAITVISLLMVIVVGIQSSFTTSTNTLRIDRDIQLYSLTCFACIAFLPIPVVLVMLAIPRRTYIDKFGAGRFRTKVIILVLSAALLTLGAAFRAGTDWLPETLLSDAKPWYFSKACFYVFDFTIEIIVVLMYLVVRVDRRFYVPDKTAGPGEYSGDVVTETPPWPEDVYANSQSHLSYERSFYDDSASISMKSYLEVDPRSGRYSLKHVSRESVASDLGPEFDGDFQKSEY